MNLRKTVRCGFVEKIARLIFAGGFLCVLPMFFPGAVHSGMKVVPSLVRVSLEPGKTYSTSIEVQNTGKDRTEELKVYLESSRKDPEGKWIYSEASRDANSLVAWARIAPETLSLPPGQKASVTLKLEIPRDGAGDFRGAIMFEQDSERMAPTLPDSNVDTADIQLGKNGVKVQEKKSTITLIQYMRVAVPVFLRIAGSENAVRNLRPEATISDSRPDLAKEGEGAFAISSLVTNTGNFDLEISGHAKILHPERKSLLKIAEMSGERMLVMPKNTRRVRFVFQDPLPEGKYLARSVLEMKVKGGGHTAREETTTAFAIDSKTAAELSRLADSGNFLDGTPIVPLVLAPSRVEATRNGSRIKPATVTVSNPTSSAMTVKAKFEPAKKNAGISAEIHPELFEIEPGKSKPVRVKIQARETEPVYGNILFAVKGMGDSRPGNIPVIVLPENFDARPEAQIRNFEIHCLREQEKIRLTAEIFNSGNVHLDKLSPRIAIVDFAGKELDSGAPEIEATLLYPGWKCRILSVFPMSGFCDGTYEAVVKLEATGMNSTDRRYKFRIDREAEPTVSVLN